MIVKNVNVGSNMKTWYGWSINTTTLDNGISEDTLSNIKEFLSIGSNWSASKVTEDKINNNLDIFVSYGYYEANSSHCTTIPDRKREEDDFYKLDKVLNLLEGSNVKPEFIVVVYNGTDEDFINVVNENFK